MSYRMTVKLWAIHTDYARTHLYRLTQILRANRLRELHIPFRQEADDAD